TTSDGIAADWGSAAPTAGGQPLGDPPLDIVGEPPAGAFKVAGNLALSLRLTHAEDRVIRAAPEAGLGRGALRHRASGRRGNADVMGEFADTWGIGHGGISVAPAGRQLSLPHPSLLDYIYGLHRAY